VKPERVRWLGQGNLLVNTHTTVWVKVATRQIKEMIVEQLHKVENIFKELNIPIITPEQMRTVTDTDNVPVGHGLWSLNKNLRHLFPRINDAKHFLQCDTEIGVALGFACCYSGGGAMRIPEVNEISVTRITSGSVRR
jgi:hypothetical protein